VRRRPITYTITCERHPDARERICRSVLEALPDWFGIPKAIDQFCRDARDLRMWVARTKDKTGNDEVVGLVTLLQHFPVTAELHLIAIRAQYHRKGLGHKLLTAAETHLKQTETQILTVKTLAPSASDRFYARTHRPGLRAAGGVPDPVGRGESLPADGQAIARCRAASCSLTSQVVS
jgi:GNAT superfamily N-acetyltransferase